MATTNQYKTYGQEISYKEMEGIIAALYLWKLERGGDNKYIFNNKSEIETLIHKLGLYHEKDRKTIIKCKGDEEY